MNVGDYINDIYYKRNFLTKVIARVDFISPIEGLEKQLSPDISNGVKDFFPIAEPKKAIANELQMSLGLLKQKSSEFTEWKFYGKDRDKTLVIIPSSVSCQTHTYHRNQR